MSWHTPDSSGDQSYLRPSWLTSTSGADNIKFATGAMPPVGIPVIAENATTEFAKPKEVGKVKLKITKVGRVLPTPIYDEDYPLDDTDPHWRSRLWGGDTSYVIDEYLAELETARLHWNEEPD